MTNAIHGRAMLATLQITGISGRKLDRAVTEETNARHGADADAGRYNRVIFAPDSLKNIIGVRNAARTKHYELTLPWIHEGASILSVKGYMNYTSIMQEYRGKYIDAVTEFLDGYDKHIEAAKVKLNGLFNPNDYPAREDIRGKFKFHVAISPIPEGNDFRVDLADAQAQAIKADIEARTNEAVKLAMRNVWERIADTVGHMASKLKEYKPGKPGERAENTFRDSLVSNVAELVDLLPTLNIAADPRLDDVARRMKELLCAEDADILRRSQNIRNNVAKAADDILADVGLFLA